MCRTGARAWDRPDRFRRFRQGRDTRCARRPLPPKRPPHDAFAVALSIDCERIGIVHTDARRDALPFRFRRGEDLLGLEGGIEEAVDRGFAARCEDAVESVADDRHRPAGAEARHDIVHGDGASESFTFQLGAEIPEGQRRIGLALQRLLRQQRGRAVDDRRLPAEIGTGTPRHGLQQEPALVERAAGDRELPAAEIGDLADRRVRRHHDSAERARRRVKDQAVAECALARHPQPVRQHEVGRAAFEGDLAGFGRGKLDGFDGKVGPAVETIGLDDVQLPGQRSRSLHRNTNAVGRSSAGRLAGKHDDGGKHVTQHREHGSTMPHHPSLANAGADVAFWMN